MTNKQGLFKKEMKHLFYVQIGILLLSTISELPIIGSLAEWGSKILYIGVIIVLFHLEPIHQRYRKAAIFMSVGLGCHLVYMFTELSIFSLAASIGTLGATYQEYCGHSEVINKTDAELSGKWHSLFNWQILSGVILGILGAPIIVLIGILASIETALLTTGVLVLFTVVDAILRIVYLLYLNRMQHANIIWEPEQADFI